MQERMSSCYLGKHSNLGGKAPFFQHSRGRFRWLIAISIICITLAICTIRPICWLTLTSLVVVPVQFDYGARLATLIGSSPLILSSAVSFSTRNNGDWKRPRVVTQVWGDPNREKAWFGESMFDLESYVHELGFNRMKVLMLVGFWMDLDGILIGNVKLIKIYI